MDQRQYAAIMFTDIAGYTALMGKDEDKTMDLLRQYHRIQKSLIEQHKGVYVKEIGDGLLAYFNQADQAIACGIDIQQKLMDQSDASVRIGIHWAEIIVEEEDIYGDGVNIASRIESLADPGGIYISEDTVTAISDKDRFEIRLMGGAKLKHVKQRIIIHAVQGHDLPIPSMKRFQALANPKKKFPILPTVILFAAIILIAVTVVKFLDNRAKKLSAEASLEEIDDILEVNWRDYSEAYALAKEAEKIIPENERLKGLLKKTSVRVNITSDPQGAEVFYKLYKNPEDEWISLGKTPLDSVQVPVTIFRWKFEKEGYETVEAASLTFTLKDLTTMKRFDMFGGQDMHRKLDKTGTIPEGMVRIPAGNLPYGMLDDFFIDRYEVTNKAFKAFVDQGGYDDPSYWEELIRYLGGSEDWQETAHSFVDRTGRPGPSTWENQTYAEGRDDYPVNGINWFEANAYARFAGKSLPTKDHWGRARGEGAMIIMVPQAGGNAVFAPLNNFHGDGPEETGLNEGITPFGVYDMPGNVREWCWNESPQGRWVRGGAWNDNPYMFGAPSQADPLDRSERNGFRCAFYPQPDSIPSEALAYVEFPGLSLQINLPDYISDEQFDMFRAFYEYDRFDLSDTVVSRTENEKGWVLEKIQFDAAYDNERMTSYLFLPTNTDPPYQSVIYGPGSNVLWVQSSDDIENFFEFSAFCEFLVRNGRALMFPVVKGTFERQDEVPFFQKRGTHQFTTDLTRIIKDYRRCLDYLETRDEFDMNKVAFYGMSMGPTFGAYLTAVDDRIKTNVFYAGGLQRLGRPEADMIYFLPRITIPTLMINGRFDSIFGLDEILKMYELLGTPEEEKKLVLFDSDHLAPMADVASETTLWLDQHFGEVEYTIEMEGALGMVPLTTIYY